MAKIDLLESLIQSFNPEKLTSFMRAASGAFKTIEQDHSQHIDDESPFRNLLQIGQIDFDEAQRLMVAVCHVDGELTSRTSKRKQFDLAKKVLNGPTRFDAGLFAFYDDTGHFRLSLLVRKAIGTRSSFTPFRRYTYFVSRDLFNKTFINQMRQGDFDSVEGFLKAFSIEAVSNDFYREFEPNFQNLAQSVIGTTDDSLKEDFALLFVIRILFLGFVQKKGWLGDKPRFLQEYWEEYTRDGDSNDLFYQDWLKPLFFDALNSPPGRKVAYGIAAFSEDTQSILQMSPFLNGELFKSKNGVDDQSLSMPDEQIHNFFEFLFQYNFTIEENTLYDEELELNPEFLGVIFERLVNQEDGAVYTPRPEVDLMCRMALVKWLEKRDVASIENLYHLFFRNAGVEEELDAAQRQGDFTEDEIQQLVDLMENVTVCDPAAGSGAFEVGMLQVLQEILENLYSRNNTPANLKTNAPSIFERKKAIIAKSLYGVEVKRWAVWINHLRLWLTLFVDMPDEFKSSMEPLLPNLTFKVRTGDSLVQRIGGKTFPVHGHGTLSAPIKAKITTLKNRKREYFYNRSDDIRIIENEEVQLFSEILEAEIKELRAAIRKLLKPKPKQDELFASDQPKQSEMDLAATVKQKRDFIDAEISDLENQKRSLKDTRPFLWSLEFAEIFFDRGGFDIIIGNPPYVRQEEISDPNGLLSPADYKAALLEMVLLDFPAYFAKTRALTMEFKSGRKPSGRSDLYTYFYIRSLRLLNRQGVHVFICSNSWLDVGYGVWLQEFLLHNVPINFVFDNHAKRSFANSDVNTIITIMDSQREQVAEDHLTRFVAFKQPFEDVVLAEHLIDIQAADELTKQEAFRVFPITVGTLFEEGSQSDGEESLGITKYIGHKWGGIYLRAPEIYFTIIERGAKYSSSLDDHLIGERYLNTGGADGFFIITEFTQNENNYIVNKEGFSGSLPEMYLRPLIKDALKENKTILVSKPDALCFVIQDTQSSLPKEVKDYILWGSQMGYDRRSVTKTQNPWFKPTRQMLQGAEILLPRSFNDTFAIHHNPRRHLSLRFYRFHTMNDKAAQIVGYLNSTPFWLIFETLGNKSLGQGVLDFFMADFLKMKIPIILNDRIEKCLKQLEVRPIGTIFEELGLDPTLEIPILLQQPNPKDDRKALDDVIFDALEFTRKERDDVYRHLCQLVWDRLNRARSV